MTDSNQIRDTIKALQVKADLIDLMETLCSLDSFLDNKLLKKYSSNQELILKIHSLIKESLTKHIEFTKNNVDYSSILTLTPNDIVVLKMMVEKVAPSGKYNKSLTTQVASAIRPANEPPKASFTKQSADNPNTSDNEQVVPNKSKIAYILDPTSCMNITGSSYNSTPANQRILMGSKVQILKDEGDTFRARLVGDNVEFSIYKDLLEFK